MTKEALKLALEALKAHADIGIKSDKAITAIKEALANVATEDTSNERVDEMKKQRHEQEPVAWPHKYGCRANAFGKCDMGCITSLHQKPLTNEQIADIFKAQRMVYNTDGVPFARAIEAAHGIKGET